MFLKFLGVTGQILLSEAIPPVMLPELTHIQCAVAKRLATGKHVCLVSPSLGPPRGGLWLSWETVSAQITLWVPGLLGKEQERLRKAKGG